MKDKGEEVKIGADPWTKEVGGENGHYISWKSESNLEKKVMPC